MTGNPRNSGVCYLGETLLPPGATVSAADGPSFSPVGGVELVAQAHGGALKTGGTPGNVGGASGGGAS